MMRSPGCRTGRQSRTLNYRRARPGSGGIRRTDWQSVLPGREDGRMLSVALLEPEIPPNTGNIARTCAATGVPLHLIGRLGFSMEDRYLRRAGIDYWDAVTLHLHETLADFEAVHTGRIFCLSAHARMPYTAVQFQRGDALLFGSESRGLPPEVLARHA